MEVQGQNKQTQQYETQILVRRSANGTSKYGAGTGTPATRWVCASEEATPPTGYEFSYPPTTFDARHYPEFPNDREESWTYRKIDIREDAFAGPGNRFEDIELGAYATKVRDELRVNLSKMIQKDGGDKLSSWEMSTASVVQKIVDSSNSMAAIQGTFRMSGVFAKKKDDKSSKEGVVRTLSFDEDALSFDWYLQ